MQKSLMTFCRWMCDHIIVVILLSLLAISLAFVPYPWSSILLSLWCIPTLLVARYADHPRTPVYFEANPIPPDVLLNLPYIDVDTALLHSDEQKLFTVAAPRVAEEQVRLNGGPSMLLLSIAALLTGDQATPADSRAIAAAFAPLGLNAAAMHRKFPRVDDAALGDLTGPVVRDGRGLRAYFAAPPDVLLPHCTHIWDGKPRLLSEDERVAATFDSRPAPNCQHAISYATREIRDGTPGDVVYLGRIILQDDFADMEDFLALIAEKHIRLSGDTKLLSLPEFYFFITSDEPPSDAVITNNPDVSARWRTKPADHWMKRLAREIAALRQKDKALRWLAPMLILHFLLTCLIRPHAGIILLTAGMLWHFCRPEPMKPASAAAAGVLAMAGSAAVLGFLRLIGSASPIGPASMLLTALIAMLTAPASPKKLWLAVLCILLSLLVVWHTAPSLLEIAFALVGGLLVGFLCRMLLRPAPESPRP